MERRNDSKAELQPAVKQYGFTVKTPVKAGADHERGNSLDGGRDSLHRGSLTPARQDPKQQSTKFWVRSSLEERRDSTSIWEKDRDKPLPYTQKLSHSTLAPREADQSADTDEWALSARWRDSDSSESHNLQPHVSSASSDLMATSAFKGFKDGCEAGSFTLAPANAVQESGRLEVVGTLHTSEGVRTLVKEVIGGLRAWQQPEASAEGLGGTYFFMDERGRKRAIVKPCDEEPLAPNNPKGFVGRALGEPGLKPTVRVGEAAMREVAAFLLDHHHFAHVPYTVLVRVTHNCFHVQPMEDSPAPKPSDLGSSEASTSSNFSSNNMATTIKPQPMRAAPSKLASMQDFVSHHDDASEMGFSRFSADDVHRIGILDLRLFNTDRHAGNMLVRRVQRQGAAPGSYAWMGEKLELIPIDHGFCLPEALEPPYFEWLHWPQAKLPFSEEELQYVESLDANADVLFLQQELPWLPEGSLRTLQVATLLLKKCAAAGLTLSEIGSVASRPLVGMEEEASELERLCLRARQNLELQLESDDSEADAADVVTTASAMDTVGEIVGKGLDIAGGRTSLVMGRKIRVHTTLSGDEMLFDLDEGDETEESSDPGSPMNKAAPAASKPQAAILATPPAQIRGVAAAKKPADDFAKSLYSGLHPRAARQHRNRRLRANMAATYKPGHAKVRRTQAAYPPPVEGGAANTMNDVFEGLQKASWAAFMQELEELMEEALDDGVWKQQAEVKPSKNVGFGMSCPRF